MGGTVSDGVAGAFYTASGGWDPPTIGFCPYSRQTSGPWACAAWRSFSEIRCMGGQVYSIPDDYALCMPPALEKWKPEASRDSQHEDRGRF